MELFREYVASLRKSRVEEGTRRERRRVRRQERFLSLRSDREDRNQHILFRDIHALSKINSIEESDLIDSVGQALAWWCSMCDHTIEHQLQCELAAQRMKSNEADYLSSVFEHEKKHSKVIFDSDAGRWEEAKRIHLEAERQAQVESIQDAIRAIMQLTEQCISSLSENGFESYERGPTSFLDANIIAQLVLDDEMRSHACEDDVAASSCSSLVSQSASKAFKAIFQKETSFSITSLEFLQLLLFAHEEDTNDDYVSRSFFDVSSIPIITLNGPKLSGKSLLSKHIVSHFGFHCVSDKDLVQKALTAFHKKSDSDSACLLEGEPKQTEDEWSRIGAALQELLLRGDAVPLATIVQMVRLQLQDLHSQSSSSSETIEAAGLLLDGVITSPEIYEDLQKALLPPNSISYEPLIQCWCGSLSVPQQAQGAEEEVYRIRNMLRMPKLPEEVSIVRESKEKTIRRSANAPMLPAPTLPVVNDISNEVNEEMTFIKKATDELADYASILTAIIEIHCSPEELFRRFAGLRVDQESGAEYHMVYCPPPPSRAPFLVSLERTQANTVRLADIVLHQQAEWQKMRHWLATRSQPNLMSRVFEINGEKAIEDIQAAADGILSKIRENFLAAQNLFRAMKASQCRVRALEESRAQQIAEREAKRLHLASLYAEKGVPLPAELQVASLTQDPSASDQLKLPHGVARLVLRATHTFTLSYVNTYGTTWTCLRSLAKQLTLYRKNAIEELQRFMHFPDDKQKILDSFIQHLNGVTPLMRSEMTFKEEVHVMVEELSDSLFRCVTETKKKWQQLVCAIIRRDTFMESWEGTLRNVGITLAQAETERFVTVVRLFIIFFNSQLGDEPVTIEEFDWDIAFASINTSENLECSVRIEKKRLPNVKKLHPAATTTTTHTYGKGTDDGSARSVRDTFDEVLQRLIVTITNFSDRFRPVSDAGTKSQKKSSTGITVRAEAFASRCAPFVEAEMACTLERLHCVRDFVARMASQGEQYRTKLRDKLLENITGAVHAQASAVNTALYVLRCCIEEESKAPRMHLGSGTFAVLDASGQTIADPSQMGHIKVAYKHPSFLTDVPLCQGISDNTLNVHAGLSFGRLRRLIEDFTSVAPQYQLSKNDFMRFVHEEDYDTASNNASTASQVSSSVRPTKSTLALFQEFDLQQVGLIDWREFIVHLLFWCKPPTAKRTDGNFYIPTVTIEQLRDSKQALGDAPLTEDTFRGKTLFFAQYLPQNHTEAYMEALWLTFRNEQTQTLDPAILLLFLCADVQLIRGAQKAICVSAQMDGETHDLAVTRSELDCVFHALSTNPRALGLYDPFSVRNIELLFESQVGSPTTISFRQMRECLMGRMMLNSSAAFHRKSFTV